MTSLHQPAALTSACRLGPRTHARATANFLEIKAADSLSGTGPPRHNFSAVMCLDVVFWTCLTLRHSLLSYGYSYKGILCQTRLNFHLWILISGHSGAQGWASECPDVKNCKWRLNPVWHRMLYSCTYMATLGVKGLILSGFNDTVILSDYYFVTVSVNWSMTGCRWRACAVVC